MNTYLQQCCGIWIQMEHLLKQQINGHSWHKKEFTKEEFTQSNRHSRTWLQMSYLCISYSSSILILLALHWHTRPAVWAEGFVCLDKREAEAGRPRHLISWLRGSSVGIMHIWRLQHTEIFKRTGIRHIPLQVTYMQENLTAYMQESRSLVCSFCKRPMYWRLGKRGSAAKCR